MEICKQVTNFVFYFVSSIFVNFLKFISASIYASNIFILTVYFKFIFLSDISTSSWHSYYSTSYIIHIISIYLARILQPLKFSLLPLHNIRSPDRSKDSVQFRGPA
jgi:hypothetical protein